MQAHDVHAHVETLLGEPVRWASVKATLAGNLEGAAPRFARVAPGRYSAPSSSPTYASHSAMGETPASPQEGASRAPQPRLLLLVRGGSVSDVRRCARIHASAQATDRP